MLSSTQKEIFKNKLSELSKNSTLKVLMTILGPKSKADKLYIQSLVSDNTSEVIAEKIIRLNLAPENFVKSFIKK